MSLVPRWWIAAEITLDRCYNWQCISTQYNGLRIVNAMLLIHSYVCRRRYEIGTIILKTEFPLLDLFSKQSQYMLIAIVYRWNHNIGVHFQLFFPKDLSSWSRIIRFPIIMILSLTKLNYKVNAWWIFESSNIIYILFMIVRSRSIDYTTYV